MSHATQARADDSLRWPGPDGVEELDLQLFLTGGEENEVLEDLRECPDANQVLNESQWVEAAADWRVDTHERRLPPALIASIQAQDRAVSPLRGRRQVSHQNYSTTGRNGIPPPAAPL